MPIEPLVKKLTAGCELLSGRAFRWGLRRFGRLRGLRAHSATFACGTEDWWFRQQDSLLVGEKLLQRRLAGKLRRRTQGQSFVMLVVDKCPTDQADFEFGVCQLPDLTRNEFHRSAAALSHDMFTKFLSLSGR